MINENERKKSDMLKIRKKKSDVLKRKFEIFRATGCLKRI